MVEVNEIDETGSVQIVATFEAPSSMAEEIFKALLRVPCTKGSFGVVEASVEFEKEV